MNKKSAHIVRMETPSHLCPWGIKAIDLLRRNGFDVSDERLESAEANAKYKKRNGFDETPQIWIEGSHVGGYDQLREYLHLGPDPKVGETYQPVIAVFGTTLAMALALVWANTGSLVSWVRVAELFVGFSMAMLGMLKLRDLKSFATSFVQYDLLAHRYVPYSNIYPIIETGGGALMVAGVLMPVVAPIVLATSTLGAVSVFKAVYIEKRDLKCACVGGGSSVPLGAVSLAENLIMITMSIWMLVK